MTPPRTLKDDIAIRVEGLTKLYRRTTAGHKLRTLKSALIERTLVAGLAPEDAIPALKDVSFTVQRGEAVGLLGSNGSGKSTLLKVVAGILRGTEGKVEVEGRTAALIELGAGFHPEISGRENIYINGEVLGLTRRQVEERFDDIVAFSGLADFIEEPVKNYSSGMYVRLGFAVAIHTDPEVLLVDEVLSVGDEAFAHSCLRRIEEFLAQGRTLLLVSHSLGLIEEICDRAVWLEKGELRLQGHPRRVTDAYRQSVADAEGRRHQDAVRAREEAEEDRVVEEPQETPQETLRWGSGEALIERARLMVDGEERYHLRTGEAVTVRIDVKARRDMEDFVFGVGILTPRGVECWGTNTDLDGLLPRRLSSGAAEVEVHCPDLRLGPGEYLLDVAIHARDGSPYDYRRKLLAFSVTSSERGVGIYFPRHTWTFSDRVEWQDPGDGIHEDELKERPR